MLQDSAVRAACWWAQTELDQLVFPGLTFSKQQIPPGHFTLFTRILQYILVTVKNISVQRWVEENTYLLI